MGQFRGGHREHTATEIGQVTNFCGYLGKVCWNLGLKPVTHHFLHLFAKQKMKTSRTTMNYDKHIHILTPQHMGWDLDRLMHVNNCEYMSTFRQGSWCDNFLSTRCSMRAFRYPPLPSIAIFGATWGERPRSSCQTISIQWNIMSQPAFGQVP